MKVDTSGIMFLLIRNYICQDPTTLCVLGSNSR